MRFAADVGRPVLPKIEKRGKERGREGQRVRVRVRMRGREGRTEGDKRASE